MQVLKSNGAEMPPSLVETLWTIIQRLQVCALCAQSAPAPRVAAASSQARAPAQPGNGAAAAASGGPSASARTDVAFPGLAVPDSRCGRRPVGAPRLQARAGC